ncbi:hypothetical protein GCM10009655_15640 [Rhodoglobus aureus]|uniref:Uncharacterized protein n=1 Tax=Rhodoglobus aureus TaxID=191497 RepID=A0ABN1VPU1_9MICO
MPLAVDGGDATIGDDDEQWAPDSARVEHVAEPLGGGKIGGRVDNDQIGCRSCDECCGRSDYYFDRMAEQTQGG